MPAWHCHLFGLDGLGYVCCMQFQSACPPASAVQPDASGWRSSSGTAAAEKTLLGLAVADASLTLINGALPSSFDAQHSPGSWWMEAIFKVGRVCLGSSALIRVLRVLICRVLGCSAVLTPDGCRWAALNLV